MKLENVRVLDLSMNMPGPYLSMLMADNGAEVIKVEQPGTGDPGRVLGTVEGPSTVFFRNLNRGKKSITLDLKSETGREKLLQLCETADVLIEGFRPGVAGRLGVDYKAVAARNPGIVYCSISAYGQTGPYRDYPAHSLAVEAFSGAVSTTEGADMEPAIPGVAIADFLSALHGLSGVLMALLRRQATGTGDYIDISMLDSVVAAEPNVVAPVFAQGREVIPKQERNLGGAAFYQIYRTKDGRHVALAGQEDKFVRTVLSAFGREDFSGLCARGPGPHQKPLIDFFRSEFLKKSQAEWIEWFEPLGVCFAPVKTIKEAFEDPQVLARGMLLRDGPGRKHIGPAIKFQREPAKPVLREPLLGEHNSEFFGPDLAPGKRIPS